MYVEWLTDSYLIESTIRHPKIYPYVSDNTCPKPEEFNWPNSDDFFSVGCFENEYMGCFCFHEKSSSEVEIHTCLLPIARGKSLQFGQLVIRFILENTPYLVISTFVPKTNKLAKRLALKCGFEIDGKGDKFNGEYTDRLVFLRGQKCQ